MKKMIGLLVLLASTSSFGASNKVCFGSTKNDDTKGVVLSAKIEQKQIYLKTIKTGNGQSFGPEYYGGGTYPSYNSKVSGRDGKVYLEYKGENSDYQDVIMVDSELLKQGTTGLLQIRARGEGFFNSVFVCKDSNQN